MKTVFIWKAYKTILVYKVDTTNDIIAIFKRMVNILLPVLPHEYESYKNQFLFHCLENNYDRYEEAKQILFNYIESVKTINSQFFKIYEFSNYNELYASIAISWIYEK